jgi:hypothetical protein
VRGAVLGVGFTAGGASGGDCGQAQAPEMPADWPFSIVA